MVEQFKIAEVQFDLHSRIVQTILPFGSDPLHVRPRFSEEDAPVLNEEVAFQVFRDKPRISHEDAYQISVQFLEHFSLIRIPRGEPDSQQISFQISRDNHFEAVVPAFCGICPRGESAHGSMTFPILGETDGNIGGVGVFDRMSVLLIPFQDTLENEEGPKCEPVHVHHERFVGAERFEYLPDALLGGNALRLFEEGERNDFHWINVQGSTRACRFEFEVQLFEEKRYFCYYVIEDLNSGIHDNGRLKASVVIVV